MSSGGVEVVEGLEVALGQKANPNGDHRFWSIFPFTNRGFKVSFFDPQPSGKGAL